MPDQVTDSTILCAQEKTQKYEFIYRVIEKEGQKLQGYYTDWKCFLGAVQVAP